MNDMQVCNTAYFMLYLEEYICLRLFVVYTLLVFCHVVGIVIANMGQL